MKAFLMMGQSNMAGRGKLSQVEKIENDKCFMLRDGKIVPMREPISTDKPEAGISLQGIFADCCARYFDEEILLVPCSVGGTKLERHMPGSDLYENTVKNAKIAMQYCEIAGIMWLQGESDSFYLEDSSTYGVRFEKMLKTLKDELGIGDVPVVTGEILTTDYVNGNNVPLLYSGLISRALRDECSKHIKNYGFVYTYDLKTNEDKLHLNSKSLRILGKRYFNEYLRIIKKGETTMDFDGKVIVVTGAAGTLCSEIAVELAKEGAKMALVDMAEDKVQAVADRITSNGGTAKIYCCDITNKECVAQLAASVEKDFGLCDCLVNGAGGNSIKAMPTITAFDERELNGTLPEGARGLYDIDLDAFESVIKLNTMGSVIPLLEFSKQMIKKGGGSILNFASMNTYCPLTRCFAYAMSKAAVANFTQSFAAYFANANVRINAIAPGFMVNERSKTYLGTVEEGLTKRGEAVIAHTPMGRFGQANDLVGCVKWLLNGEKSGFVTGVTIPIDGGFLTLGGV